MVEKSMTYYPITTWAATVLAEHGFRGTKLHSPYVKASEFPLSFCLLDLFENLNTFSHKVKDVKRIDRP